ncbi:YeiH family protein [Ornithinibacillus californiensis]|uniref:YeiH family protein n=1 Tax=Ornithinibacillus californiensis TaxID=161536 RepID=UPI00064DEAC1|nr:putative sulfate exporter family transporter [Ornithinibacillus californiensis]
MASERLNIQSKMERLPQGTVWSMGVGFTFLIASIGYILALVPGFSHIGQLACAILIAILYRQFFGYPETLRNGINFSSKRLLRAAIILYGLKLNMVAVLQDGIWLLLRDTGVIIFAILTTIGLAKLFKVDKKISLLLGVGTGVCGAAAIAAVAPIVKSKDEDTAISVGIIALIGTIFSIIYIIIRPWIPLDALQYGVWSGTSLHEVAHVALAAAPAGDDALAVGILAKLGRVFLLIPLCFILIGIMRYRSKETATSKIDFPWFLVGFIICSLLGSYVLGHTIPVSENIMEGVFTFTTWLLTAAMVGLGLNVSLKDVRTKALRPLTAMVLTSVALSIIVFFIV